MSAPQIPAGGTILDTFKKSFTAVPVDATTKGINTPDFLEATESLVTIFDALGSVAFSPVKSDMLGNVKKIRERFLAAPTESETVQDLVRNEIKTKKHVAAEGLLWLTRGLDFTAQALDKNISNPSQELADSFREAYSGTLKPHHGFLIKPIFSAAMGATPYRKDFYAKLGSDEAKVQGDLAVYLKSLKEIVVILQEFLASPDAKW